MKSIVSILSRYMLMLCFSSILIFGGLTVYFMVTNYQKELIEAEETIIGGIEKDLIQEVSRIQDYIEFSRKNSQGYAIKMIKDVVIEAHNLAMNLYNTYKDKIPEEELKLLIKRTLRSLVYEHADSYLFIVDLNGIEHMNPNRPEFLLKDVRNLQTPDKRFIVKEMIDFINKQDEGYIEYLWNRPKDRTKSYQKTSYIKKFEPYGWILGTGIYHMTVTQKTQDTILQRMSKMNTSKDQYIFAGQLDGTALIGPAKGKNIISLKDSDGIYIIQELIKTAQSGGGFLTYKTPSIDPRFKSFKKMSYTIAVPEWDWYIGSGINIERLEYELQEEKNRLRDLFIFHISVVLALAFLYSLAILFLSSRFKHLLADNFNSFERFFRKGTDSPVKIDRSKIAFTEFDKMAVLANSMIDSRESAKKDLLKSEITYREIFNSTKDAIGVMDINKRVFTDVNQAFLDFFDMKRTDAIGMSPGRISFNTPPYDYKYTDELFNKAQSGESVHFEWMVKKSNGEPFWTDNLARIASIGGKKKLLIVMRDITESRKMQKIMVQTEKMMSIGGLAAGMAHEINNPLGIIMQITQNIIRRTSPTLKSNIPVADKCGIDLDNLRNYMDKRGITNYLHNIQEAGVRAATIVKSMLDFSRKSNSVKTVANIESVIETAISLASNDYDLKKQYDFKKIKIIRDYCSAPMFNFTEMEISQVILNLIKNAAQALSEDKNTLKVPTIIIRTSSNENFVRVEIEDNGPGVPHENLKRIFEPFYSTKSPGLGTGLGLSVSYFIVTQNHGGTITADSTPGEGTRFTILLPIMG